MNRSILIRLSFLILLLTVYSITKAQWTTVDTAGFTPGIATDITMAFDSNDTAYMAYTDNLSRPGMYKYNGTNWVQVGGGFISASGSYTKMAIDGNNIPYAFFAESSLSDKATVMKYSGGSWTAVGSHGFSSGGIIAATLAFDSNDTPYVAFNNYNSSTSTYDSASVMKYDGTNWVNVGSARVSASEARFLHLAFDSNDNPYIVYSDVSNYYRIEILRFNGSSWAALSKTNLHAGQANYLTLAFDSDDSLYVSFANPYNGNRSNVMKFDGSSWRYIGNEGFSAGQIYDNNLYIDGNGVVYNAYNDAPNSYKPTLMKYNGRNWVAVGTIGFSTSRGDYVALAVNSLGCPYVAYRDQDKSYKATVKRYPINVWNGSTWIEGAPDSTKDAYIASNTAPTAFTCNNLSVYKNVALNTGTNYTASIYGDIFNYGNGVTGQGTLTFTKNDTAYITGDTIDHSGTILVESGCVLSTDNLLRLTSDATNTGRIGNSAGTIVGNVMVQRYIPGKRCFRFLGHPFSSSIALSQLTNEIDITGSGGSSNGFTTTTTNNPSAFWFDVTSADTSTTGNNPGWQAFTSATTNSWNQYEMLRLLVRGSKGEGLSVGNYTPGAATLEVAGTVNQGTQVITLTKGSGSEFVACGNPFASGVQMSTVAKGTNIGANYYAWDATAGAAGAYITNPWTMPYVLPSFSAFFTTTTANSNNTVTFEEADKTSGGAALYKTTAPENWVELYISDSSTRWDRLLIDLNDNAMDVEDNQDGKKLYNPGLDFFTLSKDNIRLAVDVRPYTNGAAIPLGLTAYKRYNKYVIKTGMYNVPQGTKLYLHDKYLNKKEELKAGIEYWFEVTAAPLSQGNQRFEINMSGEPTTSIIQAANKTPQMQLIPNPAHNELKVSFDKVDGTTQIRLTSIAGRVVYQREVSSTTGSVVIQLQELPDGIYLVELQSKNARFIQKLIKK